MARKKPDSNGTGLGSPEPNITVTADQLEKTVEAVKNETKADLKKLQAQVKRDQTKLTKAQSEIDGRLAGLENYQSRVLETIGIFAALLSFIAFEAQIFKGPLSTASLVGVSSIILGALVIFVLLLDMAFDSFKIKRLLRIALFVVAFGCIVLGFLFAYIGYKNYDNSSYYNKDEVDSKIEHLEESIQRSAHDQESNHTVNESDNELLEFKNCILKLGLGKCL